MGIEEFGLGLATIAALAVSPSGAVTVEKRARCPSDGYGGA